MAKEDETAILNTDPPKYFEGVEKLIEIWFTRKNGEIENCDLRKIPREKWATLLETVKCSIMSVTSNDNIDAYVLSESSLFVAKRRLIMKTCGNTTPLRCLKSLVRLVYQEAGFDEVDDIFYSRKNFKEPMYQPSLYHDFRKEASFLDSLFKDRGGFSHCFGPAESCWYLYALNPLLTKVSGKKKLHDPDQTLEILMTDLDESVMSIFTREQSSSASQATHRAGIDKLLPNMKIDDFLFDPHGYSMNGITKEGHYMTIHITPEPEFSYVSFETNVPLTSYKAVIQRVIDTFQPGNFVVTLFANQESIAPEPLGFELGMTLCKSKWRRQRNLEVCNLPNYKVTFAFYSKFPS